MQDNDQDAFQKAIQAHQDALEAYGEDDERTVNALLVVMLLAPDNLFSEMEELAAATKH